MDTYSITDKKLHLLSQIIAKANRTFVKPEKDDSHTNFYFDPAGKRIFGRWINTEKGKIVLSINLISQSFEWLNAQLSPLAIISYSNKTYDLVEEEVDESLSILGLKNDEFRKPMHYEIPVYSFANDMIEPFSAEAIMEWSYIRRQANEAVMMCLGMFQKQAEIRIWPHHFDTGIYLEPNENIGIGFGFAMQDDMVESPYLYVSGYPLKKEINYLNLPDIGIAYWEVNSQWKGAILPYTQLNKLADKYRKDQVEVFINNSVLWFLNN